MRKIIFSLLLFLMLSFHALAFTDDIERYPTGAYTDNWVFEKTNTGSCTITINNTVGTNVLHVDSSYSGGASSTTLTTISPIQSGYFSFITRGSYVTNTANTYTRLGLYNTSTSTWSTYFDFDFKPESKYELVGEGSSLNLYINGVLSSSKAYTWEDSTLHIRIYTQSTQTNICYVQLDDFTTSSIIGAPESLNEATDNLKFTWSSQLMRSYPTSNFSISLYSLTNLNNTGLVKEYNIPEGDNSSSFEYGYFLDSRANTLNLNYGLYLLEMTRDSTVLTDTYFYYDSLVDPVGLPEILFTAETNVNAEIRDEDNNGGEILAGDSVYLYPDSNENGIYNITYDVLETPYSIQAELTKIYNTSDLNGTNLLFSGLSSLNYYVSVDGTAINGTNGSDTWNYMVTWDTLDSHIISFAPDYTLPGVYGYIKNSETQNPIKSATLAISNGTFTDYLFTDDNGMYYFTQGMVPGSYNVTASKSGYTTSVPYSVTTQNGSTTRQDIFLDPESGAGVYYASHDVTFTVLEYWYSSAGLPGVSYAVYDNENESVKNGTTGSKGTFTITDMDAGKNYTFILTYNNQTYTEYLEPGLTEYNLILNKEGIVHQYYNSWLNLTYAETSNNATVLYTSNKTVSAASLIVTASNGTIVQSNTLNTTSGTFLFNFTDGDYILQFDIEASDGSTASQAWSISSPSEVDLFPDSYPTWLKNTLFVAIIIIFLLAFGKSKNDIACGAAAVLTSFGYYFEWLSCGFNFVVLVWIIALGAIYLHYKRTGAVG